MSKVKELVVFDELFCLAERGGFEPPLRLITVNMISNHAPSTTRTPLQMDESF